MLPKAASVGFFALTSAALAGTASRDLAVTATVVNRCLIKGPDADGPVSVSCNSILSYKLHRDVMVVTVTF